MDINSSIVRSAPGDLAKLKPVQQQAIALLMQGYSQVKVAEVLEVDRVTVGRWLERDDFKAVLAAEMHQVQEAVNTGIRRMQTQALDTIEIILDDPEAHERTRLDAAKYVLDKASDLPELPPAQGISPHEFMALLDCLDETTTVMERNIGRLVEALGLATADEYLAMNPLEKALIGVVCESVATILETGEPWKPAHDDLLIDELRRCHREHPEWAAAAQRLINKETDHATKED